MRDAPAHYEKAIGRKTDALLRLIRFEYQMFTLFSFALERPERMKKLPGYSGFRLILSGRS